MPFAFECTLRRRMDLRRFVGGEAALADENDVDWFCCFSHLRRQCITARELSDLQQERRSNFALYLAAIRRRKSSHSPIARRKFGRLGYRLTPVLLRRNIAVAIFLREGGMDRGLSICSRGRRLAGNLLPFPRITNFIQAGRYQNRFLASTIMH